MKTQLGKKSQHNQKKKKLRQKKESQITTRQQAYPKKKAKKAMPKKTARAIQLPRDSKGRFCKQFKNSSKKMNGRFLKVKSYSITMRVTVGS